MNCDGAVNANGSGFGGLLRNSEGNVVYAFAGRDSSNSVFQQELNGVHIGIQLAYDQGFNKIQVASDSLRVVRTFNKLEYPPWDYQNQVREIIELAAKFEDFRISHAYRETNRAADYLAEAGVQMEKNTMFFMAPFTEELCRR